MQKQVLEYLCKQGGLSLFAFFGEENPYEDLKKVALVLNTGAHFVLLDFSGKDNSNCPFTTSDLFSRYLTAEEVALLKNSGDIVIGGIVQPSDTEDDFRKFYYNLEQLKSIAPNVIGILPQDKFSPWAKHLLVIAKFFAIDSSDEAIDDAGAYLEDNYKEIKAPILWLSKKNPSRKRFPHAVKAIKGSFSRYREFRRIDWKKNPAAFARTIQLLLKAEILKKNPLDGFLKVLRNFFLPILLVAIILPFLVPTSLEMGVSNVRDRFSEQSLHSQAPYFEFTFDGKETLQRISRYAIGRFNAVITNDRMVINYAENTLNENGYKKDVWRKGSLIVPPEGTVLRFSKPEDITRSDADSLGIAWKYWTSIISDSIAYLTEYYYEKATKDNRQHNGIDLASRHGARILAPFSAKAWTSKDERGGIIIGLVREKDVILFMHCDQLLYLDGQEVMQGDPIATVGVTGHTTGPHAHIVTGLISPNGAKKIGNVRYNVIDPMTWYAMFRSSL